jgi:hypothetical protein
MIDAGDTSPPSRAPRRRGAAPQKPRTAPPAGGADASVRSAAASGAPTGPLLRPDGSERARVRRSKVLADASATDPSPKIGPSRAPKASRDTSRGSRPRAPHDTSPARRRGLPSRVRHELDRTAHQLRERYAQPTPRRTSADPRWMWQDPRAQALERSIREILSALPAAKEGSARLSAQALRVLNAAHDLLETASSAPPASKTCAWCNGPMPEGLRREARFCHKRCRQASSRFTLGMRAVGPRDTSSGPRDTSSGSRDTSSGSPTPARQRPPSEILDTSRAMRFAYANPPYPGRAHYYAERAEVDHRALIEQLTGEFPDGWALSTSASALQDVLALCPPGVRVCSWHRPVRPTRSRRPISAWEPVIVAGGRELSTARPQRVRDALAYGGRYRAFPGALTGMKPPQFAAWLFALLGARPGDQLVDMFPGSGAIGEAWRRYTGQPPFPLPAAKEPCPDCFGWAEPCAACIAAAGDPAPGDFELGPAVEQVRRCECGRVYGAYHAGRALCFLMEAPGRRQVDRCVRCGRSLTAGSTSQCGPAPPAWRLDTGEYGRPLLLFCRDYAA